MSYNIVGLGNAIVDILAYVDDNYLEDELGDVFTKDIKQIGVNFDSSLYNGEIPTARSMILISSDAARTMNTYLGSASFIENSDIDEEIIRNQIYCT